MSCDGSRIEHFQNVGLTSFSLFALPFPQRSTVTIKHIKRPQAFQKYLFNELIKSRVTILNQFSLGMFSHVFSQKNQVEFECSATVCIVSIGCISKLFGLSSHHTKLKEDLGLHRIPGVNELLGPVLSL